MWISSQWTKKERIEVMKNIALLIQEKSRSHSCGLDDIFHCADNIYMVSTANAEFLEKNRERIFKEL